MLLKLSDVRRRRLTVVLVAVATTVLAGCTPPGLSAPIAPGTGATSASGPSQSAPVTTVDTPAGLSGVIGIDGIPTGFNPYEIADYSLAAQAVAGLVLPAVSTVTAAGTTEFNPELIAAATITSAAPFTVTYQLNSTASWSDGTPITAEDFAYLADQLKTAPGTVGAAGYRAITSVGSKDAGKTVVVQFDQRIADWAQLFPYLLPAHILKDLPGGFTAGLAGGLPVSGNRYKMSAFDTTTGEITLVRNDKYWGTPPRLATVVLRIGKPQVLLEALGRGDLQAAWLRPDAQAAAVLAGQSAGTTSIRMPLPGSFQLVLNTTAGPLADSAVRTGLLAGLDRATIAGRLTGWWPQGMRISDLFGHPSTETTWPAADPQELADRLTGVGYQRPGSYYTRDGQVLRLTLAYPSGSSGVAAAATEVQRELGDLGVEIDLVRLDPRTLVTDRIASGQTDLALVFVPRGPSDALTAATTYGCPIAPTTDTPKPTRTGNLSGYCDTQTDAELKTALMDDSLTDLRSRIAAAAPVAELGQPMSVWVTTPVWRELTGDRSTGSASSAGTFSSPLAGLGAGPGG